MLIVCLFISAGLPGSVGAVAVSRISTALHSEATPVHHLQKQITAPEPSLRLVMATLFLVTIPVEIIFLSVLHGIGWLELPVIFIAASIIFFCITVSADLWIDFVDLLLNNFSLRSLLPSQ